MTADITVVDPTVLRLALELQTFLSKVDQHERRGWSHIQIGAAAALRDAYRDAIHNTKETP